MRAKEARPKPAKLNPTTFLIGVTLELAKPLATLFVAAF